MDDDRYSAGPLEGLRVLDLTRLLPGGYATLLMADLGADVVKIEEPGKGDYIRFTPPIAGEFSAAHIALNRNKRSVTLNLKDAAGAELFRKLVTRFDVVIESFRPGVMDRLGVGWSALQSINPRLIYCAITGYGQDGPRSQTAGHDVNYIGYAGLLSINGAAGRRPVIPGVQVGDLAGGGMSAVIAILAALRKRDATGTGEFCDVSMMDGAFSWLSIHMAAYVATSEVPQRELMYLSGAFPCYRIYPAADGFLAVGALEPQFWSTLVDVLERPDLAGDAFATGPRRQEVIEDLESVFGSCTRAEWMVLFEDRDACVSPINDFAEATEDPQLRHRQMLIEDDIPGVGPWIHVGNPLQFAGVPDDPLHRPPPRMGEHTAEIFAEVGVDGAEIESLRDAGTV